MARAERGQTPQDFAFGVSIMLLTLIAVFALLEGGLVTAYDESVEGDIKESADRVAAYLVGEYAVEDGERILRYDRTGGLDDDLAADPGLSGLKDAAGLNVSTDRRVDPHLNVTVVNSTSVGNGSLKPAVDGGTTLAWGEEFDTEDEAEAASATRVITLEGETDDGDECETVCWLIVRVW